MASRTDEVFRILGIGESPQAKEEPQADQVKTTSRQAEIENILSSAPAAQQEEQAGDATPPPLWGTSPDKGRQTGEATPQSTEPAVNTPQTSTATATPQSAPPTAPLTQGSLAWEGRSAEQVQQEIADSRKELARLQSDAAYILTAEPGAELGRQMDEERARIEALEGELNSLQPSEKKKTNVLDLILGTVEQGAGQVVQGVTGALDWLFGDLAQELWSLGGQTINTVAGNKPIVGETTNPITAANEWVQETNRREAEYYAENAEGNKAAELVNKYGPSVVAAIPQAVIAVMTSGASAATTAGLEAASSAAQAGTGLQQLASMVANSLGSLSKNPSTQAAFIQASGSSYNEAIADGASKDEAELYALINGTYNTLVEMGGSDEALGGMQSLPKHVREALEKGNKNVVLQYVRNIVNETGEEVIQGMGERGLKTIYTDDVPVYSPENPNAIINPAQMAEEAKAGAIVSTILGTGQLAAQSAISARKNANAHTEAQAQTGQEQSAAGDATTPSAAYASATINPAEQATEQWETAAQQAANQEERAQMEAERANNREQEAEAAVEKATERYFAFTNDIAADRSDPNFWEKAGELWNDVKKARQALNAIYNERTGTQFALDEDFAPDVSPTYTEEATTPQSATPTAPLTRGAMESAPANVRQETQAQAAETAQETQRATPQAETPPTAQNAAQAASGELNRQAETNTQEQTENAEADAQFNELAERYGAIPTGETPARDVQVPQRISEEEAVGRTARTIMEAAATPDNRLGSVREAVVDGKFSYTEISNQELADSAAQRIQYDGWQDSLKNWTAEVRQNKANENLAAMGAQLLNNAGNSDMSAKQYVDLVTDYNRLMHNLGRGLAAARILKTLTPEGKLYGILRSIQSMVDEANGKYNVEIDQALIDEYRAQTTDKGRDAVISKMQQNIADQIPSTWMDKFTALRYTNMLGNFKTQIRNVGGNILMTLGRTVKDKLAAVIESAASAASGGQVERTKSLWAGTPLYGEAMRDFTNVEREAMGESKYSDSGRAFDREVQEKRTIFKNNGKWGTDEAKTGFGRSAVVKGARKASDIGMAGMEAYRKATNWAMEQGDRIFVRINYADALAGWLKAHGISSIAEADADTLDRARQYAIKQAQEATFRDTNSVSQFVSTFDKGWGETGFGRGAQKVMQGIAPFRKTPANVAVRAEEYSPLGILNTAYKVFEAKQGKNDVTWSDVIDSAAKTLTGSGIYFLGYLMAAAGSARGKEEDEKKAAFENMQGLQDYSIILPNGKSISMNWVAPYSIPFFMGVLTQEAAADGGLSWDDAGKILGAVSDPMLEMSMLSGLNDALDNISQYNGDADALPQFLMNAFASYLSQGVTNTLLGQFEQASQENRQTTYTDSTLKIPTSLQYILGKASAKTPGVDYNQQDYIDAWGRKQSTGTAGERIINSFINPAYVNEDRSTPVDDELQRLYDAGQTNVLPQKAARSTKVNGERLSPEEYEAYSITKGQQSLELVQDFIESDAYQNMSDEARADVISDLYSIAASRAAKEIADGRKESYTSDWDDEAKLSDVVGYLTTKSQIEDAQGSKDYTLLDALIDTVTEQKKDVQEKLNKDFSMLDELIYGKQHGVDAKTIYVAKGNADANGNGKISQEEMWNYLERQLMPNSKKSVLWDILTSGTTGYAEYAEKQK